MLISHRNTAYVDSDEMERAAGRMEILAKGCDAPVKRAHYEGAAVALRILGGYDLQTYEIFERIFDREAFGE